MIICCLLEKEEIEILNGEYLIEEEATRNVGGRGNERLLGNRAF